MQAGQPDRSEANYKSTCALKTAKPGSNQAFLYEGVDYHLRALQITPLTRWVLRAGTDTWTRIADYSQEQHEWYFCLD